MPFPAYNLSLDETVALSPLSKKNEVMSVRNIGGHCEIPSFSSNQQSNILNGSDIPMESIIFWQQTLFSSITSDLDGITGKFRVCAEKHSATSSSLVPSLLVHVLSKMPASFPVSRF